MQMCMRVTRLTLLPRRAYCRTRPLVQLPYPLAHARAIFSHSHGVQPTVPRSTGIHRLDLGVGEVTWVVMTNRLLAGSSVAQPEELPAGRGIPLLPPSPIPPPSGLSLIMVLSPGETGGMGGAGYGMAAPPWSAEPYGRAGCRWAAVLDPASGPLYSAARTAAAVACGRRRLRPGPVPS